MLRKILQQIPDNRTKRGRQFQLDAILLLFIWAILCNANSYRSVHTFIEIHLPEVKRILKVQWKRPPSYCGIRKIILSVKDADFENAFRNFSHQLAPDTASEVLGIDGKTIRGSFDYSSDQSAMHVLMAFCNKSKIILAHQNVTVDKTNEIPILQMLVGTLSLSDTTIMADALHCQKKLSR